jgi:hypothetical protein
MIAALAFSASVVLADTGEGRAERIERLLKEAQNLTASGIHAHAFERCEQALRIDPFSIAARSLQEKIARAQMVADARKRGDIEAEVYHPTYPSQHLRPLLETRRFK